MLSVNVDTPSKELLFSTVKITNTGRRGVSTGTGFILGTLLDPGRGLLLLATNKHVVANAESLTLSFMACTQDRSVPDLGRSIEITIENPEEVWVGHPDPTVDVALIQLGGIISQLDGQIFYRSIPSTQMPSDGDGLFIDVVEEVTFVGYPDGRRDPLNLTPIMRRGTTATPVELNFGGKPTFLIDGSVFGGSSGSPVFLMNNGTYRSGPNSIAAGNRLVLLGIIHATHIREDEWPVVADAGPHVRIAKELNLGVVYNWHALNETIEEFNRNPPSSSPFTTPVASWRPNDPI